jgi:hypothetical protein
MTVATPGASIFVPVRTMSPADDTPIYASRRRALLIATACALLVLISRVWLIATFGSSLPFWDQWGAEGTGIYKQLIEGTYDWQHLWSTHNEHRIALTRLSAIAVFFLNGAQWDARVQCLANTFIVAFSVGLFAAYLARRLPPRRTALLCALLVLAAALPFSWENTIAGFQNAFYFLVLITIALLWTAAHRAATPGTFALLAVLSILSVFTLATGILAPLACCFVLALRAFTRRNSWGAIVTLMLPPLVVVVVAAMHIPHLDYHQPLKAQGLVELVRAGAITTSWPLPPPGMLLFALPFALFLWRLRRRREAGPVDLFFCGLFAWSALTALATAHARGHGMLVVPSRYTDLLAFGCLAYVYFALRLLDDGNGVLQRRRLTQAIAGGVPALLAAGLLLQSALYVPALLDRHFLTRIETVNVRAFVDGDATALAGKPPFYIPFPDAASLGNALSDPTMQALLPVSVAPRPSGTIRACGLQPAGTALPHTYALDCTAPGLQAVAIGPLSAGSYWLWKHFAAPLMPRLAAQSAAPSPQADMRCAIDALNASKPASGVTFVVPYAATLRVGGWSGRLGQTADARALEIGLLSESGRYYAAATRMRLVRDDVATALSDAGLKWSGFDLGVDASAVPHGQYRVLFGEPGFGTCDTGHFLQIARDSDELLNY